jgi:hypothetical protein
MCDKQKKWEYPGTTEAGKIAREAMGYHEYSVCESCVHSHRDATYPQLRCSVLGTKLCSVLGTKLPDTGQLDDDMIIACHGTCKHFVLSTSNPHQP